jgi:hypothetical protein
MLQYASDHFINLKEKSINQSSLTCNGGTGLFCAANEWDTSMWRITIVQNIA